MKPNEVAPDLRYSGAGNPPLPSLRKAREVEFKNNAERADY